MTSHVETPELDAVDWRILEALQKDARLSYRELGRRVGLSAPAAAERVRRLEDAVIITGYRADVAVDRLFPVTAIVRINAPEEQCRALGACVKDLPEVLEATRTTGSDRLVIKVVAHSVTHLDEVAEQLRRFGTPTMAIVLSSRRSAVGPVPSRERRSNR
jgi:Lrp/AsnC family leucine-responsive transcriptional regulator